MKVIKNTTIKLPKYIIPLENCVYSNVIFDEHESHLVAKDCIFIDCNFNDISTINISGNCIFKNCDFLNISVFCKF